MYGEGGLFHEEPRSIALEFSTDGFATFPHTSPLQRHMTAQRGGRCLVKGGSSMRNQGALHWNLVQTGLQPFPTPHHFSAI